MANVFDELNLAWIWREQTGIFERSQAVRVFHGPGEGKGDLRFFAVERFGDHYWITEWESQIPQDRMERIRAQIVDFYRKKGAVSIVGLNRPEKGIPAESQTFWGNAPVNRFEVTEQGSRYFIQLTQTRHPGIFLDHFPLRQWLKKSTSGLRVLNAFAYTGSLSVAAGMGGASYVTTLDLSKPTIQWAKENWELNQLPEKSHRLIAGDVFEWLPRLKKEDKYDCVILDPPSFSHGKKDKFSTAKDLEKLHSLAMDLLSDKGLLITSINSSNVTWKKFETDVLAAARSKKMQFNVISQIDLPDTFPTPLGSTQARYLKGWILKRT